MLLFLSSSLEEATSVCLFNLNQTLFCILIVALSAHVWFEGLRDFTP